MIRYHVNALLYDAPVRQWDDHALSKIVDNAVNDTRVLTSLSKVIVALEVLN